MGTRLKGSMPATLLSPLDLTSVLPGVQVLDVQISVPAQPSPTQEDREFALAIREEADQNLVDALDSLRLSGASEQQLGALMGATRLACLLRLLDEDLDEVMLRYLASDGQTPTVREVIARIMVPELERVL